LEGVKVLSLGYINPFTVYTLPKGVDGANVLKCDFLNADHV